MRKVFAAFLLAVLPVACGVAQEAKQPTPGQAPTPAPAKLDVGDPAPPLKNVTQWLNGPEPKTFENDKVYVLEFWATWCGPCIRAMPHLTELQAEYKAKGLVVIGLTNKDGNGNNQKSVTTFVEKNKEKVGYVMGYSDGDEVYSAYMDAAGQNGIPCSFVVDKAGKIAYIGHPMSLDEVLPKVLDGTWRGKADIELIAQRDQELEKVLELTGKPEAALERLAEFGKKYPEFAKKDDIRGMKVSLLLAAKKFDEAKPLAEELIAASDKTKKMIPAVYALGFADTKSNPEKKHFDVAVKALDTALKYEEKNMQLLLAAVEIYTAAGDKAKAADYGKKAVAAAPDDDTRKQVEQLVTDLLKKK